ncbi:MAG: tripartite tricarboxylate transporter substrate binding protein [Pseudomonadota bacterium]
MSVLTALAIHAPLSRAQAQGYPNKLIKMIVSFPAGSATDIAARLIARQLTKLTGQPVIVENKGGASGFLACAAAAKAPADGYTLLVTTGTTHAANPSLFKELSYDPVKDFSPVTSYSLSAFVLVVAPTFPAQNVAELVELVKASPDKYTFASGNAPGRIGGEMFKMMSNTRMMHIPYKGAPQALTDLIGGQVNMIWADLRTGIPMVQSGKLKALAATGRSRLRTLPNVPTMIEQGFPDYELYNWGGVYVPAKTPPEIISRLNTLIHAAVRADQAAFEASGGEINLLSPAEFAQLQARDTAMWARVTKAAGMEPE